MKALLEKKNSLIDEMESLLDKAKRKLELLLMKKIQE